MHSVANLATLQTPLATFFYLKKKKAPKHYLVSENHRYSRTRSCFPSMCTHLSLTLRLSAQFQFRKSTFPIAREGGREALSLSAVECIVLLTLWFIILSCLGRCKKRSSHNILLNRSIVHAIRLHVSEVPRSGAVNAHTTCVPRPSPPEPLSDLPLTTKPGPAK